MFLAASLKYSALTVELKPHSSIKKEHWRLRNCKPRQHGLSSLTARSIRRRKHCGKNVKIVNTANGKSVVAKYKICAQAALRHFSRFPQCCPMLTAVPPQMSTGAYDAIGSQDAGVLPIQWGFMQD
ncbi:hypothetical protein H4Q26_014975 [Puccinia striiformis f. sp. tritici PST-130]|nr:hypothetical protein H4Q26_014975 [Puccinia striiformis f. sp. tritici PST-130]